MKKIFPIFVALFYVSFLSAQCVPNDTVTTLIYPAPMNSMNPTGGIEKIACIGTPYDFVFTVNVPEQFVFSGVAVPLDSAIMMTSDAILNLPAGLTYACNPGDCVFKPLTKGCALISGSVENSVAAGDYNLSLDFTAYVSLFGQSVEAPYTYPDPDTTASEDRYTLKVRAANDPVCTVGLFDQPNEVGSMRMAPNPANDRVYGLTEMQMGGRFSLQIFNSTGGLVLNQQKDMVRGDNLLEIAVADWPEGIYWLRLSNGQNQVKKTFVVAH